ncbi:MAG: hypothetical protein GWQ05_21835 [Verrucomicrobiaceae bacterium]|nr:hypothetical protein [Verrucomicrobiaceae bacterium]NCF93572.1 hypothetical protein [Verrucomicrobiaceae bacterium]
MDGYFESQSPSLKGVLFPVIGLIRSGLILAHAPDWKVALLLAIALWAFCRFYYFAFYVLEHYADSRFRYAGLCDLARYLITGKPSEGQEVEPEDGER